jgi:hypothetical protein
MVMPFGTDVGLFAANPLFSEVLKLRRASVGHRRCYVLVMVEKNFPLRRPANGAPAGGADTVSRMRVWVAHAWTIDYFQRLTC